MISIQEQITPTALESLVLTPDNIFKTFRDLIIFYSKNISYTEVSESVEKRIKIIWTTLMSQYVDSPFYNLSYHIRSFNMLPASIKRNNFYIGLVLLAFLLQRQGPNKKNEYAWHIFNNDLAMEDRHILLMVDLAKIRFFSTIPSFTPDTIMYDLNWIKLAFPYDEFRNFHISTIYDQNLKDSIKTVDDRRATLWRILANRKKIFCSYEMKEFEKTAYNNMRKFILEFPNKFSDKLNIMAALHIRNLTNPPIK